VLENSDASPGRIAEEFDPKVAELVRANTHDDAIPDKIEQYKEMFARCRQAGTDALAIKAADLLDNTRHFEQGDAHKRKLQLEKIEYFLDLAAESLEGHAVWRDLRERYRALPREDQSDSR
jgi:(p)ppGpp synthase/HD superfamily hydrolase